MKLAVAIGAGLENTVKALDLSCLYQKISSEGSPTYHPAMMLKIYFYAYARGIFSSRKIVQALKENIAFIFLAAWQKPDFRTVSDFRKNNLKELGLLFSQIVQLCKRLGMVKLGHIAIDSTKIKANASDAATYDRDRIEKEIKRWLEHAEAIDRQEDALYGPDKTGDELPEDIRDPEKRIQLQCPGCRGCRLSGHCCCRCNRSGKGKEALRIYRCRSCRACRFLGCCTADPNGRSVSRHPYEKELCQMRQKLDSASGKAIYGKRRYTVEPPFGHIKSIMGFTSFLLRGRQTVRGEFKLISIAHNLRKIWLHVKAGGKTPAGMCPAMGN